MDGRGWACQVIDLVDFQIEWKRNIMPDHFEVLMVEQVLDIASRAGKEIIDTEDNGSVGKQALAEV